MSNPLGVAAGASGAVRAVRQAEGGIDKWLIGLVTGAGSSPSHIIITGILGVVPGLGQVMDARDLIIVIVKIASATAAGPALWIELVITLIGCIPGLGDGIKVGLKLMQKGHGFGRAMEAGAPLMRGNIQKFFTKIDWNSVAKQCKAMFAKVISAFIEGLDSWFVTVIADKRQVAIALDQLRAIAHNGPKMIDEAIKELKALHTKMLSHPVPASTAARSGTSSRALVDEANAAAKQMKVPKGKQAEGVSASANTTSNATRKAGKPKKQKWSSGIPAEHITDYYVKHKQRDFTKVNNHGKLTEERCLPHNGLDHLWLDSTPTQPSKKYVVGETKSSIFDSMLLLAALPASLQEQFNVLKEAESKDLTENDKPNIFHNEGRDVLANQSVDVEAHRDTAVRKGVNKADAKTGLATQMSHKWISSALQTEKLTARGVALLGLVEDFEEDLIPCPYHRWITLVTGRQLHLHQKSKGADHNIQTNLKLPDNILLR